MAKKGLVTQALCDERFQRTMDAIKNVAEKSEEARQLLLDKTKELKEASSHIGILFSTKALSPYDIWHAHLNI